MNTKTEHEYVVTESGGNFLIDDSLLAEHGETDFSKYADYPFDQLMPDFFVPADG